jgi:hypothetical protein
VVAALVVAGILTFIAFLLLSAYSDDFSSGSDGRPHAFSSSAVGFRGIVRLVEETGGDPLLVRTEADLENEALLVATVEPQTSTEAIEALLERRGARTTLIVLPKWATVPDPERSTWVRSLGPLGSAPAPPGVTVSVAKPFAGHRMAHGSGLLDGIQVVVPAQAQTVTGPEVTPLLTTPDGAALLAQVGDGALYVLADPDLMNNHGLHDAPTARSALRILERLNATDAGSVMFDVTLNGFGANRSILKLPFEPPYLPLTVALFVAALLAGLHGAFRFGPEAHEDRAIAFGKRALVENSAGLIQLARREHRTGGPYADIIRESAALAAGAPAGLRGSELDSYLDHLSPPDAPKFTSLAERARSAADRSELLSAARALFQWKKDWIR